MKRRYLLLALTFAIGGLVAIAACGGGSGSGFVPVAYTGSIEQATLDGINAPDYAALAEAGNTFGMIAPIPLSITDSASTTESRRGLQALITLSRRLPNVLAESQVPAARPAAPISDSGTFFCGVGDGSDGSIALFATWDAATGDLSATMTFRNCDEGIGAIFNGVVTLAFAGIAADIDGFPDIVNSLQFTMDQTYRNLRVTFTALNETMTMYAQMFWTYNAMNPNATINTLDMPLLVMALNSSGLTAQIKNYSLTITEFNRDTLPADDDYDEIILASVTAKTELYDHLIGYISAYTLPANPVLVDPGPTGGPYSGILRMEGAGGSFAEVDYSVPCETTGFTGTYDTGTVSGSFCYHPDF